MIGFSDAGPRLALVRSLDPSKPTVVFVRGVRGTSSQFRRLVDSVSDRANAAMYLYENSQRLYISANLLREDLRRVPGPVVIVSHSMGTLLPAYVGATTGEDEMRCVGGVYINPLIGGSKYADNIALLGWLAWLKPIVQRVFFPACVRDLVPASDFQQAIFGPSSRASSFSDRSVVLFTEQPGREPDIAPGRDVTVFGSPRSILIAHLGRVMRLVSPLGHSAPLAHPEIVVPLVNTLLERLRSGPPCGSLDAATIAGTTKTGAAVYATNSAPTEFH